jgi:hypothetical protein
MMPGRLVLHVDDGIGLITVVVVGRQPHKERTLRGHMRARIGRSTWRRPTTSVKCSSAVSTSLALAEKSSRCMLRTPQATGFRGVSVDKPRRMRGTDAGERANDDPNSKMLANAYGPSVDRSRCRRR